jgi:hypothetical protein
MEQGVVHKEGTLNSLLGLPWGLVKSKIPWATLSFGPDMG